MKRFIAFIVLMILGTAVFAAPKNTVRTNPKYYRPQSKILDSLVRVRIPGIQINDPVKVVKVVKEKNKYDFYFNQNAGTFPFVEGDAAWFIKTWKRLVGSKVPVGNIYLGSDNITTLDTSPLGNNGSPSGNRNRLAV